MQSLHAAGLALRSEAGDERDEHREFRRRALVRSIADLDAASRTGAGVQLIDAIPFFVDGQTKMTESSAILQYLAARHGGPLNVPNDDSDYGAWLNWLYLGEATLTFPQTLVLRYTRLEPKERRNPQVAEDYAKWFAARLRAVDRALETQDYLVAGRFTAADISVGYALLLASTLGLSERFSPADRRAGNPDRGSW